MPPTAMGLYPESTPATFLLSISGDGIIGTALTVPAIRTPASRRAPMGTRSGAGWSRTGPRVPPMKPLRLVSTPTRNRRLNEILGLVVLVAAALLFLAL